MLSYAARVARAGILVVTVLSVAPRVSAAQSSFSVAAGASIPTGDFGKSRDVGYHALAAVEIRPPLAPLGLRIEGMFNEFESSIVNTAATRVYGATGNGVIQFTPREGFYVIGGVGIYRVERPGGDSNELGLNVGGGYRFPLTGFSAFVEGRYHTIQNTGARFVPITFGITF
jgi:hypothetical protein